MVTQIERLVFSLLSDQHPHITLSAAKFPQWVIFSLHVDYFFLFMFIMPIKVLTDRLTCPASHNMMKTASEIKEFIEKHAFKQMQAEYREQ